ESLPPGCTVTSMPSYIAQPLPVPVLNTEPSVTIVAVIFAVPEGLVHESGTSSCSTTELLVSGEVSPVPVTSTVSPTRTLARRVPLSLANGQNCIPVGNGMFSCTTIPHGAVEHVGSCTHAW